MIRIDPTPLVSAVVTTRNEALRIERCLRSLREQTWPRVEIIVVDNGSTDGTPEIARRWADRVVDKGPERSAQRNHGLRDLATGGVRAYFDADMILSRTLLEKAVRVFQEENAPVALHVGEIVLGRNFFSKVRRFERGFYDGTVIDGARVFLADAFLATGGFDESFSGPEDWDLDLKLRRIGRIDLLGSSLPRRRPSPDPVLGAEMETYVRERGVDPSRHPDSLFHDESEFDLKKYLGKKSYYIRSFDAYRERWGADHPAVRKQLGGAYRMAGVFLEKGKGWRLLAHPLLSAGMVFLRFAVGLRYLFR